MIVRLEDAKVDGLEFEELDLDVLPMHCLNEELVYIHQT
jgi:hypothetical protein